MEKGTLKSLYDIQSATWSAGSINLEYTQSGANCYAEMDPMGSSVELLTALQDLQVAINSHCDLGLLSEAEMSERRNHALYSLPLSMADDFRKQKIRETNRYYDMAPNIERIDIRKIAKRIHREDRKEKQVYDVSFRIANPKTLFGQNTRITIPADADQILNPLAVFDAELQKMSKNIDFVFVCLLSELDDHIQRLAQDREKKTRQKAIEDSQTEFEFPEVV